MLSAGEKDILNLLFTNNNNNNNTLNMTQTLTDFLSVHHLNQLMDQKMNGLKAKRVILGSRFKIISTRVVITPYQYLLTGPKNLQLRF